MDTERLGAKLGPRLANLIVRSHVHARQRLAPHHVSLAMQIQEQFFRLTGSELKATLGPIFQRLADDPDVEPATRRTMQFLADGHGQLATLIGQQVAGAALGNTLSQLLSNFIAPGVYRATMEQPLLLPPIGVVAELQARGLAAGHDAYNAAAMQGLNGTNFSVMVAAAQSPLPADQVVAALHRGYIDPATAETMLADNALAPRYHHLAMQLGRQLPGVADLALGLLRGSEHVGDATARAEQLGYTADDLALFVDNTGEPPGVAELLSAFRRGIIAQDRLARGVRQSRLRNEWLDVVEALRYEPMSPADAIAAAVQGHLPVDVAKQKAEQGGLLPDDFQPLYETHGNPPGVQEMLELLNRGETDVGTVTQAIRESRVKDKYIPDLLKLRRRLPPERTVVAMIRHGVLTVEEATAHLLALGFSADDAHALIAEGQSTKTQHHKELAESTARELYLDRAITRSEASPLLLALGYDQAQVDFLFELVDMRRAKRYQDAAINHVHAAFVARKLPDAEASALLDRLKVPAAQRDEYLDLWTLERLATIRRPTAAEYAKAVHRGLISETEGVTLLQSLGFDQADAQLVLSVSLPQRKG